MLGNRWTSWFAILVGLAISIQALDTDTGSCGDVKCFEDLLTKCGTDAKKCQDSVGKFLRRNQYKVEDLPALYNASCLDHVDHGICDQFMTELINQPSDGAFPLVFENICQSAYTNATSVGWKPCQQLTKRCIESTDCPYFSKPYTACKSPSISCETFVKDLCYDGHWNWFCDEIQSMLEQNSNIIDALAPLSPTCALSTFTTNSNSRTYLKYCSMIAKVLLKSDNFFDSQCTAKYDFSEICQSNERFAPTVCELCRTIAHNYSTVDNAASLLPKVAVVENFCNSIADLHSKTVDERISEWNKYCNQSMKDAQCKTLLEAYRDDRENYAQLCVKSCTTTPQDLICTECIKDFFDDPLLVWPACATYETIDNPNCKEIVKACKDKMVPGCPEIINDESVYSLMITTMPNSLPLMTCKRNFKPSGVCLSIVAQATPAHQKAAAAAVRKLCWDLGVEKCKPFGDELISVGTPETTLLALGCAEWELSYPKSLCNMLIEKCHHIEGWPVGQRSKCTKVLAMRQDWTAAGKTLPDIVTQLKITCAKKTSVRDPTCRATLQAIGNLSTTSDAQVIINGFSTICSEDEISSSVCHELVRMFASESGTTALLQLNGTCTKDQLLLCKEMQVICGRRPLDDAPCFDVAFNQCNTTGEQDSFKELCREELDRRCLYDAATPGLVENCDKLISKILTSEKGIGLAKEVCQYDLNATKTSSAELDYEHVVCGRIIELSAINEFLPSVFKSFCTAHGEIRTDRCQMILARCLQNKSLNGCDPVFAADYVASVNPQACSENATTHQCRSAFDRYCLHALQLGNTDAMEPCKGLLDHANSTLLPNLFGLCTALEQDTVTNGCNLLFEKIIANNQVDSIARSDCRVDDSSIGLESCKRFYEYCRDGRQEQEGCAGLVSQYEAWQNKVDAHEIDPLIQQLEKSQCNIPKASSAESRKAKLDACFNPTITGILAKTTALTLAKAHAKLCAMPNHDELCQPISEVLVGRAHRVDGELDLCGVERILEKDKNCQYTRDACAVTKFGTGDEHAQKDCQKLLGNYEQAKIVEDFKNNKNAQKDLSTLNTNCIEIKPPNICHYLTGVLQQDAKKEANLLSPACQLNSPELCEIVIKADNSSDHSATETLFTNKDCYKDGGKDNEVCKMILTACGSVEVCPFIVVVPCLHSNEGLIDANCTNALLADCSNKTNDACERLLKLAISAKNGKKDLLTLCENNPSRCSDLTVSAASQNVQKAYELYQSWCSNITTSSVPAYCQDLDVACKEGSKNLTDDCDQVRGAILDRDFRADVCAVLDTEQAIKNCKAAVINRCEWSRRNGPQCNAIFGNMTERSLGVILPWLCNQDKLVLPANLDRVSQSMPSSPLCDKTMTRARQANVNMDTLFLESGCAWNDKRKACMKIDEECTDKGRNRPGCLPVRWRFYLISNCLGLAAVVIGLLMFIGGFVTGIVLYLRRAREIEEERLARNEEKRKKKADRIAAQEREKLEEEQAAAEIAPIGPASRRGKSQRSEKTQRSQMPVKSSWMMLMKSKRGSVVEKQPSSDKATP